MANMELLCNTTYIALQEKIREKVSECTNIKVEDINKWDNIQNQWEIAGLKKEETPDFTQKALTTLKMQNLWVDCLANSKSDKARMLSLDSKQAGKWLQTTPKPNKDEKLFHYALRFRLGAAILKKEIKCQCGTNIDIKGYHFLNCKVQGKSIHRHNIIRNALANTMKENGLDVEVEKQLLVDSNRRPGDVYTNIQGQNYCIDVTITLPTNQDMIDKSSTTHLHAAGQKEKAKHTKYENDINKAHNTDLVVIALEAFGSIGNEGKTFMKKHLKPIFGIKSKKEEHSFPSMMNTISTLLQFSIAETIISKLIQIPNASIA